MKLELVTRRDVSYVELQRDKKHSLGFTIRDGTEEDPRPVVKCVNINSPAAKSFAVAKGDVVLSVNGISTSGKTSKDVRQMFDDAGSEVNFQVQYKMHETRIQGSCVHTKQRLTIRLQKTKGSFGFLLRKCSKYSFMMEYPVISNIMQGSPVHKRGHLQSGDRLLAIDNINLSWMSLSYIASLLQAKDEADFTFEYNVGVINFAEMDSKLDLDIDVPVADLGISFSMSDEDYSIMYISGIRQGSVADRCGVFSEGDVILSINDKDVKNLTVSKAYFLLRNVKKCRRISFVSSRREMETLNEKNSRSSTEDTISIESFTSDMKASNWKHLNTPVSSNFKLVERQVHNSQNVCYIEQIKNMDKFQSILSIMSSLKQALSALTRQAFTSTSISADQNCTACNDTEHAIKLCTSCLAKMNVKCAQSMDVLRDLVSHFIKFSSNMFDENDDQLVNISLKNVIHVLKETLPNIFHIPELQQHLAVLADKIACADKTCCSNCDKEVKSVMLIVKQLLLILSIRDDSVEYTDIAEHLVCCLLDIKFPCSQYSRCSLNSNVSEKHYSSNEDFSESVCIGINEEFSSNFTPSNLKDNSETNSNGFSHDGNFNSLQLKTEIYHDYLKLTHIQSISESKNSVSPNSSGESNRPYESSTENHTTLPKEIEDKSNYSSLSDDFTANGAERFSKNRKTRKIRRSQDSLIKFQRPSDIQNFNQNRDQSTHDEDETASTIVINENLSNITNVKNTIKDMNRSVKNTSVTQCKNMISTNENRNSIHFLQNKHEAPDSITTMHESSVNHPIRNNFSNFKRRVFSSNFIDLNEDNVADFFSESTSSSSRYSARTRNSVGTKKMLPETNNLTLKNEGHGFGLRISEKYFTSELPVIEAIEPKGPADKEGVLKPGDRILAINGVMTSDLSPEQFSLFKNKALAARTLTLRVEFDVYDEKFLFGTFDVVLNKTLKIGLIYEDMKEGIPLVVKGIAKGSAAHRSGQIFPGDEITFIKCKRKEVFDPVTSSFVKQRIVILTIRRDPKKVLDFDRKIRAALEVPDMRIPHPTPRHTDSSSSYTNSCFQQDVSTSGKSFEVKKTAIHHSSDDSLLVDHEVTLYRDPKCFDFGILLGEHPVVGQGFVKDIRPDGPAHKSGVIQKYDRILEVNGVYVHMNVYQLFEAADNKVNLLIRRTCREESDEVQREFQRRHK